MPQYLGLPYKPIHEPKLNPHLTLNAYKINGVRQVGQWVCKDCGMIGAMKDFIDKACTKEHKPCPHCGCAPLCAPNCPGIMAIMEDDKVYIAGSEGKERKHGNG